MTSTTIDQLIPESTAYSLEDKHELFAHPENLDAAVLDVVTSLLQSQGKHFVSSGIGEDDIRQYLIEKLDIDEQAIKNHEDGH